MTHLRIRHRGHQRRGAAAAMVVICVTMLLAFSALTVDVAMLYNARADLQRTADAAAHAGANRLLDNHRLKGDAEREEIFEAARNAVAEYTSRNEILNVSISVVAEDVTLGYLKNPYDADEQMSTNDPDRFNAVRVVVRRDSSSNGPIALLFAHIFGHSTADVSAAATAAFMDGIDGFRVTPETGNAGLMPLALKRSWWDDFLAGFVSTGDNYAYDPVTGDVVPGSDGIPELNLYPGNGPGQLPPGNFGTVDIGSGANSTADISRQILEGVNADDLSYHGGELSLGGDGAVDLNGDTGLSAGFADELEAVIGQPRTIPLFSQVTGPGNNANFTVTGFAGIRIMNVKLSGSMKSKRVIIQPAFVTDDSIISAPSDQSSYFVYKPLALVR